MIGAEIASPWPSHEASVMQRGIHFAIKTLLSAAFFAGCAGAGPVPGWLLGEFGQRLLFRATEETGSFVLVRLPAVEGVEGCPACDVRTAQGDMLPFRVVHADEEGACLLVSVEAARGSDALGVYFGAGSGSGSVPDEHLRDPRPIELDVHRMGGQSAPNSWTKMRYLYNAAGKPVKALRTERILDAAFLEDDTGARNRRKRDRWIVVARSYLHCPADGVCRFALRCGEAAFVRIDGEVALARAGVDVGQQWGEWTARFLKAGAHRVELYATAVQRLQAAIGWQPPGAEEIERIPPEAWITARAAEETRVEHADRALHAAFSFRVLPAYGFRGAPVVFVPVQFVNRSVAWLADSMECKWSFGSHDEGVGGLGCGRLADGAEHGPRQSAAERQSASGEAPVHVFTRGGRHTVRLTVRDRLGFTATAERTVDCSMTVASEYPLACVVSGLPAACYPRDVIEPVLAVSGSVPDGCRLLAEWEVCKEDGRERRVEEATPEGGRVELAMRRAAAADLDRIDWRVTHHGIAVGSGTVKFLDPPFAELPCRVEGDRLYGESGAQLVLVPHEYAGKFAQPPITTDQAFGTVTCVDDFLVAPGMHAGRASQTFDTVLGRIVDGPYRPVVRVACLPFWEEWPGSYGPLVKLVEVRKALDADTEVAVLSVGLPEILKVGDRAAFERHAAALSDMISATMGCAVVWVTPPAYLPEPAAMRPFAAAIRRVADARGMPVADLFSAFFGLRRDFNLFIQGSNLCLSGSGQGLTAQVIARALLAGEGKTE